MRTRHEPATAPASGKVAGAGCPQAAKLQGRPGVYWWARIRAGPGTAGNRQIDETVIEDGYPYTNRLPHPTSSALSFHRRTSSLAPIRSHHRLLLYGIGASRDVTRADPVPP